MERDIPDARATAATPPRPSPRANEPANTRRCRSSNNGNTTANTDPNRSSLSSTPTPYNARLNHSWTLRVDGIESQHEVFDYGSKPMGIIPDQDGSVVLGQQLGMRSRGYRGAYPAGQEERISAFHQLIDDYIAGTRP